VLAIEEEATVIANLATEDERNGSGTGGPIPKKKKQSSVSQQLSTITYYRLKHLTYY